MASTPRTLKPKPLVSVFPALISDQTSYVAVGLTSGQLREIVRKHQIPHRLVGQRLLVAVDDLLAFVREVRTVDSAQSEPAVEDGQPGDVDAVLARLGRKRTA